MLAAKFFPSIQWLNAFLDNLYPICIQNPHLITMCGEEGNVSSEMKSIVGRTTSVRNNQDFSIKKLDIGLLVQKAKVPVIDRIKLSYI